MAVLSASVEFCVKHTREGSAPPKKAQSFSRAAYTTRAAESALSLAPRPTLPSEHSASLTARTTPSGRRSDVAALSR